MTAVALMVQGTGSDVGKSVIVAGLCRAAMRRGVAVTPFKPQNMSNNAAACPAGGEIGRAQALQAMACGIPAHTDHNPVLLKPQSDRAAQVIVHGRVHSTQDAAVYMSERDRLLDAVLDSFRRLSDAHSLIIVEGAGSPAEINLRDRDIANMGFASRTGIPVCLLADIERGGVIASVVGTQAVLSAADAALIHGFIVNKFRGDPRLFEDGLAEIERRTGWPAFGVIPWLSCLTRLPEEDAVPEKSRPRPRSATIKIAAPVLSRMANFDDADPLRMESDVDFRFVSPGLPIPRDTDLLILFGTKSTRADLEFLREQGWHHDIIAHVRAGGRVFGICGGYQMLGRNVVDVDGIDGEPGTSPGLGLLDIETTMNTDKKVRPVRGHCPESLLPIEGYEIHVGETLGADCERPVVVIDNVPDGASSLNGQIAGTYVHGLLASDAYRSHFLAPFRAGRIIRTAYSENVESALDELADALEASLDIDALFAMARRPKYADEETRQTPGVSCT